MNYMGGKHRQGKNIAKFINDISTESTTYVEPFCGALGVARWVMAMSWLQANHHVIIIR